MSISKLPSGKFRVQIRRKNSRIDQVFDTELEAEEAEKRALSNPAVQGAGKLLKVLWDEYSVSGMFTEKESTTQETERVRIKPVLQKLGNYAVSELGERTDLIYDYIDERLRYISKKTKNKLSNSTVRLEIAALSALIAFAKNRRLVRENFVSGISRPATRPRTRRVPMLEQSAFQAYARNSDERIAKAARFALLIRHLGCRPGELSKLLVKDVELRRHQLTFRNTKNKESRCIHLTKDARVLLNLQLEEMESDCPYVFSTKSKKGAWVPYNYSYGVEILRKSDDIDADYHAHAGRREFISRAIEESIPYGTIKKQTGHKSAAALEMYDQGFPTAPALRKVWNQLAEKIEAENLAGVFDRVGLSEVQREKMKELLGLSDEDYQVF